MMPDVNVRRKYIQTQPFEKCVGKMDKNEFTSKWAQSKVSLDNTVIRFNR